MEAITAVVADSNRSWRAWYGWFDDEAPDGMRVERCTVLGWAARGPDVCPVRVEPQTGRGVLVGSEDDPWRDALLAVITAGEDWQQVEGTDERVRAMIRAGVEEKEST